MEDVEFLAREVNECAALGHTAAGRYEANLADVDRRIFRACGCLGAPDSGANTCHEFAPSEWLCDRIVRSHLQPPHLFLLPLPGPEHPPGTAGARGPRSAHR